MRKNGIVILNRDSVTNGEYWWLWHEAFFCCLSFLISWINFQNTENFNFRQNDVLLHTVTHRMPGYFVILHTCPTRKIRLYVKVFRQTWKHFGFHNILRGDSNSALAFEGGKGCLKIVFFIVRTIWMTPFCRIHTAGFKIYEKSYHFKNDFKNRTLHSLTITLDILGVIND